MKKITILLTIAVLLLNCNNPVNQKSVVSIESIDVKDTVVPINVEKIDTLRITSKEKQKKVESTNPSPPPTNKILVRAYLVYQNGNLSKFNLIDNIHLKLWNTTRGEGSAGAISFQTKVIIEIPQTTEYNHIEIMVNGVNSLIYRSDVFDASMEPVRAEFVLNQTGCENLTIRVYQKGYTQVKKDIPFMCSDE